MSRVLAALSLFLVSGAVLAHPGHPEGGFAAGFAHPLLGVDHLLAMLAVGFWAARSTGARRLLLPAVFVACMGIGAAVSLPFVEPAIAVSLLVLGMAIAAAVRMPAWAGVPLVAAFALVHGQAHFAEIPPGMSMGAFAAGMLLATAALHAAGLGACLALGRAGAWLPRVFGAGTAVAGAWLLFA